MRNQRKKYIDRSKNFISIRNVFTFQELEQPLFKHPEDLLQYPNQNKTYTKRIFRGSNPSR